jgi:amino acid adenylation domain-containing protein/thioester reductase-like protein
VNQSKLMAEKLQSLSKDKARLLQQLLAKRSGQTLKILPHRREVVSEAVRSPASSGQRRLWFIDHLEGGSSAYHLPLRIRLVGELQPQALRSALNELVRRHEILRTLIVLVNGEPAQDVRPQLELEMAHCDLTKIPEGERETEIERHSKHELETNFDLQRGPLVRARLLKLTSKEHVLQITLHHIISDGLSLEILFRELVALYEAACYGQDASLPTLPIQYGDFAHWQHGWMSGPEPQKQLTYWRDHLRNIPELLELATDRPRPPRISYRGASSSISLPNGLSARVRAFARNLNLTVPMVLHATWAILLSRLSGQADVVLGVPVAGRRRTEFEGLIGLFVNTLAVRVSFQAGETAVDVLEHVREGLLGAYAHPDVPFEQVVEALQPTRSLSHSPIFQATFAIQNAPRSLQAGGLNWVEQDVPLHASQFDLTLAFRDSAEELAGKITYATDLFDRETIEGWADSFSVLLQAIVEDPSRGIEALPLLSDDNRKRILDTFNATEASLPSSEVIHEAFEAVTRANRNAVAVSYQGETLTFEELNSRANQVARYLVARGIGPDNVFGLCVDRSLELFVGLLGILKAGGAYLPLDPTYPPERLAYMLEDAKPRAILTLGRCKSALPTADFAAIALDDEWEQIAAYEATDIEPSERKVQSDHLAYVIYTSGSTGRPKGVMIEHRSALNLWSGLAAFHREANTGECVALNASFNFDASVQQVLALAFGKSVVLIPEAARRDAAALGELVVREQVSCIDCTPAQLRTWLSAGLFEKSDQPLRLVLVGGEAIDSELWASLARIPTCSFYNVYGPTECTVDSTAARLVANRIPHIGRPMFNRRIYILDPLGAPVPVGARGEIYIGGSGIARGYLNRPELTEERFLPDPYNAEPNARMYKTGDLGRWRADGTIDYLGRNDSQVKIRGFRMELGEIEAELAKLPQVAEVAVVAHQENAGEQRLVAYIVPVSTDEIDTGTLRSELKSFLPDYMIPSAFVVLPAFPRTPSGKLDRNALPAPDISSFTTRDYEAPRPGIEEMIAGIWQSLLRVDRIGRHDNFFELGGHSLLIVRMLERLRAEGKSVSIRCVFERPTIIDLASSLGAESQGSAAIPPNLIPAESSTITPEMLPLVQLTQSEIDRIVATVPGGAANVQDIYPLTPLQEGLVFHSLLDEEHGDTYVLTMLLSVSSRIVFDKMVGGLRATIDRHDILRTSIVSEQLKCPVQVVHRRAVLSVEEGLLDTTIDAMPQLREKMLPEKHRIHLHRAPLMRLQYFQDSRSDQCFVLLYLHHTISDHVTLDLITDEVRAHMEGSGQVLEPSVPYRNHVAQALAYAKSENPAAFFSRKLSGIDEPTAPFEITDIQGADSSIKEAYEDLPPDVAHRIRVQSRRLGISNATLFHAAWALVVARTSARNDVVFGTLLSGRMQSSPGAHQALGLFINTLPLRLRLADVTAKLLVEQTQRELLDLLVHEQAPLSVAQRSSGIQGSVPLFTSLFNYRHSSPDSESQWPATSGVRILESREGTNYPIVLSVDDLREGFRFKAQTRRGIDPNRLNAYMRESVTSLLTALESDSQTPALALGVLPAGESEEVTRRFNATDADVPYALVHELFEKQVRESPSNVAVSYLGEHLTYDDLNRKANRLARYLTRAGIAPGDYIPVLMQRSLQMLVAQLAVLKCGAVYVPVDPILPRERLEFIIRDCRTRIAVSNVLVEHLESVRIVNRSEESESIALESDSNLHLELDPQTAAYVMYTSGSTGSPKGVVVPHCAITRLAIKNGYARIKAGDCIAHYSNPSFDASTFEIWACLLTGAKLLIVEQPAVLDAPRFAELLMQNNVSILYMSVGLFNQYTEALADVFRRLDFLMVGGDALELQAIRRVLDRSAPRCLMNVYGPTECTTFATSYEIRDVPRDAKSIPIGRPISNGSIYILSGNGQPVPVGVTGEIYIGGQGVATGYLNQPELTADRFAPDPYSKVPGARMYRTGDLGRWRSDGTVEYLGRNDFQVKIRGFRIELGEIEARLTERADVKEAVVLARQDGSSEKRLVAYIVPNQADSAPSAQSIRESLKGVLPEYMVPSAFMLLDNMPLSSTGKVNRRALPAPEDEGYAQREFEAPQGPTETALAALWGDLLHTKAVGREDNFFDLGGHSLLAVSSLARIKERFGVTLRVPDLYRYSSLKHLATRIDGVEAADEFVDLKSEAALDDGLRPIIGSLTACHHTVLLTGATGFVGRFLLEELLRTTQATIYCVVRAKSDEQAGERIRRTLEKWDLWRSEYAPRIIALAGDLCADRLGVNEVTWDSLTADVDCIYHCATSMNHLETYDMAKPANVGSAKTLLGLATCGRPKLINYISTLDVFSPVGVDSIRTVDEHTPIDHEKHSKSSGYAASKWVGEKIFLSAQERGIPCNVFRLGLVWADSECGRFDDLQQVNRVLKSSLLSGCGIRGFQYPLPPTPVDFVARAIVFLASRHFDGAGLFHISSNVRDTVGVFERCNELPGVSLELLTHFEWINEMKRLFEAGQWVTALPLIEYAFSMDEKVFNDLALEKRAQAVKIDSSATLRELADAGIEPQGSMESLLRTCVEGLLVRDADIRIKEAS